MALSSDVVVPLSLTPETYDRITRSRKDDGDGNAAVGGRFDCSHKSGPEGIISFGLLLCLMSVRSNPLPLKTNLTQLAGFNAIRHQS